MQERVFDPLAVNFRRLAAGILKQAVVDAQSRNGLFAWPARRWLAAHPFAGRLLAEFGIEQGEALAWVRTLPPVTPVWIGPAPENHYWERELIRWIDV